jgi:nucleotide-binding universal stress UspA family protein
MRALIWIVEDSWETTVADADALLPPGADLTLLHVAGTEAEALAGALPRALLGRHPPPHAAPEPLQAISERAAQELLADARIRLGRPARLEARRGRIEHEVVAAAESMDLLVLARAGDRRRPGPHSLGHAVRFVVDHAPCGVLLVWPAGPPAR